MELVPGRPSPMPSTRVFAVECRRNLPQQPHRPTRELSQRTGSNGNARERRAMNSESKPTTAERRQFKRALHRIGVMIALALSMVVFPAWTRAAEAPPPKKSPNILILWGDDIGFWNISAYNLGMMGYKTPNIDRIAKEGALFTDWYAQQSCTAGR